MRAEEIMIRSEIRQMLNEAGLNRDTLKGYVEEAVKEIVKKQVDQAIERLGGIDDIVRTVTYDKTYKAIEAQVHNTVAEKLRYMRFNVDVNVSGDDNKEN